MRNYKILWLNTKETFKPETLAYSDSCSCLTCISSLGVTFVIPKDAKMAGL